MPNNFSEIRKPMGGDDPRLEQMRRNLSHMEKPEVINVKPPTSLPSKNKSHAGWWVVMIIIIILILAAAVAAVIIFRKNSAVKLMDNKTEWQAIFLADGQVYFGKLTAENKETVIIKDIYYLQTPGDLQQGTSSNLNKLTNEVSLIKLGNEIHGPTDEMRINRAQVQFVEDLKPESKIVKAIKDYVSSK